jgi:hypothetical protein
MKVKGSINEIQITMLVDTGSTHNFLSIKLAKKLGLALDKDFKFEVLVANGEKSVSQRKCHSVQVWLQGTSFILEIFLLPLRGYDSVFLGAQWLRTLGPILRDFSKLGISFQWKGKQVSLRGATSPQNMLVGGVKMEKQIRKQ